MLGYVKKDCSKRRWGNGDTADLIEMLMPPFLPTVTLTLEVSRTSMSPALAGANQGNTSRAETINTKLTF